jgi:hypothetical protein
MSTLLRVPFFPDEVLTSFISRTARANGRSSSTSFCKELGINYSAVSKGDRREITRLASALGIQPGLLAERALCFDGNYRTTFRGESLPRGLMTKNRLRFCPACLHDDEMQHDRIPGTRRYRRISWMLLAVSRCHRHHCELHEYSKDLKGHLRTDFCRSLDSLDAEPTTERLVSAEGSDGVSLFVHERLCGIRKHGVILDQLPLATVIDFSFILGAALSFGKHFQPNSLTLEQAGQATAVGLEVLGRDWSALQDALDKISASSVVPPSMIVGGTHLYGRLYNILKFQRKDEDYDLLRRVIRDHALDRFPLQRGAEVFGTIETDSWIGIAQLAKQENTAKHVVRRLLRERGLCDERPMKPQVALLITQDIRATMTIRNAAATLGCTPDYIRVLSDNGLLGPIRRESPFSEGLTEQTADLIKRLNAACN